MRHPEHEQSINFEGWNLIYKYTVYAIDEVEIDDITNESGVSIYDYFTPERIDKAEGYFFEFNRKGKSA